MLNQNLVGDELTERIGQSAAYDNNKKNQQGAQTGEQDSDEDSDSISQLGTGTTGTTGGSGGSEPSGNRKWPVRGLDEKIVTKDNLGKILKGEYEDADHDVQRLFLFMYCDCALAIMHQVPRLHAGAAISLRDYFKKFPEITCAMVRVVVLEEANKRTAREKDKENQTNPLVGIQVPEDRAGQKSKGGRPKDVVNFDKGMQSNWMIYTNTEIENRKDDEDNEANREAMTWYQAAVEEMDRKTAPAPATATDVADKENASDQQNGQAQAADDTDKEEDSRSKSNMAFFDVILRREAV